MNSAINLFNECFRNDPYALISKFKIKDKDTSNYSEFDNLWPEQKEIIDEILEGNSLVILKPRQIGATSACIAALSFLAFLSPDPITIVILSFKRESSRELFEQARGFYESLPNHVRKTRPAKITANELKYLDSGARIILKGAKDKEGTRSLSFNYLIMSEFSFMEHAEDLLSAVKPSLGKGQIILESTASHYGDPLHKIIEQTVAGNTGYKFLFFDWTKHKKYQKDPPRGFVLSESEKSEGLTPAQAFWKREEIAAFLGDESKFKREYPRSLEEAYSQLAGCYIQDQYLKELKQLKSRPDQVIKFQQPQPNTRYTIGVDCAEGTGRDFSSIHVLDAKTFEIAALYRSNTVTLTKFAEIIGDLSFTYGKGSPSNKAVVNIESNSGGGGGTVTLLLNQAGVPIYLIKGKAWETNKNTRPQLYETVRESIINHKLKEVDDHTYIDLRAVQQDNHGRFSHSDGIISLGLALIAAKTVSLPTVQPDYPHLKLKR